MEESYTTRRVVIIVGSIIGVLAIDAIFGHLAGPLRPFGDAAAGYAFGVITKHYWS